MNIPVTLNADFYKESHYAQYSPHTEVVYSTWTPRKSRMSGIDKVVFFGLQYFIKEFLIDNFNKTFFNRPKEEVISEFKRIMKNTIGNDYAKHWEDLYDLGYLPLKICALPEGTLTPIRCPMFTIENTLPEFYWLTNFIETVLSTMIWKPMTSATIALEYRKILDKWAEKTCDNNAHVDYQAHDFAYRGLAGIDGGMSSGAGHLLLFKGTDTIPAILFLEKYYNANVEKECVGCSIAATEHSVAETNIIEIQELLDKKEIVIDEKYKDWDNRKIAESLYMERLFDVYKSGFFSYVGDTYNLWAVIRDILPIHKDKIMNREGRVVIRPDSGIPEDILCGLNTKTEYDDYRNCEKSCKLAVGEYAEQINKGVIELLWDIFGGTVNSKGYKVLDSHIGCIYGDAITLERAEEICRRLESKGFASSNVVFGVGSFTYQFNTRDTFGFALKTTYGKVNDKELLLYKDPFTDDGTKKSQKGRVAVVEEEDGLKYIDELYKDDIILGNLLLPVFENGKLLVDVSLSEIRERVKDI